MCSCEPVYCYRRFKIELGAQSQMISIRIVHLLIISICVGHAAQRSVVPNIFTFRPSVIRIIPFIIRLLIQRKARISWELKKKKNSLVKTTSKNIDEESIEKVLQSYIPLCKDTIQGFYVVGDWFAARPPWQFLQLGAKTVEILRG